MEFHFIRGAECEREFFSLASAFPSQMNDGFWTAVIVGISCLILWIVLSKWNTMRLRMVEKDAQFHKDLVFQKELLCTHLEWIESERRHFSTVLHDELLSQLRVIQIWGEIGKDPSMIQQAIKNAMGLVRKISHDLTPPLLEDLSLVTLLENLLSDERYVLQATVNCSPHPSEYLSAVCKLQVLRIVQEILNAEYEAATFMEIDMRHTPGHVAIRLEVHGAYLQEKMLDPEWRALLNSRAQFLQARYKIRAGNRTEIHLFLCFPTKSK